MRRCLPTNRARKDRVRRRRSKRVVALVAVGAATVSGAGIASEPAVLVGVASNFRHTAIEVAAAFEAAHGHEVVLSSASTGALYAQVVNGAPFDVVLAADAARPARLERNGQAVSGSRYTYARGSLVLWSSAAADDGPACLEAFRNARDGRVALANPETAPYGAAAREVLRRLGLWEAVTPRRVTGENVGQAMAFAATGNATWAFVAAVQLRLPGVPAPGCTWRVPADYHAPIDQQAVLLTRGAALPQARAFHEFLRSEAARRIIADAGYTLP